MREALRRRGRYLLKDIKKVKCYFQSYVVEAPFREEL